MERTYGTMSLPPGWEMSTDARTGRTFYINHMTKYVLADTTYSADDKNNPILWRCRQCSLRPTTPRCCRRARCLPPATLLPSAVYRSTH